MPLLLPYTKQHTHHGLPSFGFVFPLGFISSAILSRALQTVCFSSAILLEVLNYRYTQIFPVYICLLTCKTITKAYSIYMRDEQKVIIMVQEKNERLTYKKLNKK